jgi:hypothetical protein
MASVSNILADNNLISKKHEGPLHTWDHSNYCWAVVSKMRQISIGQITACLACGKSIAGSPEHVASWIIQGCRWWRWGNQHSSLWIWLKEQTHMYLRSTMFGPSSAQRGMCPQETHAASPHASCTFCELSLATGLLTEIDILVKDIQITCAN